LAGIIRGTFREHSQDGNREAERDRRMSAEVDRDQGGDPLLLHRDAVEAVRDLHGLFVVGDHQDL
jgi:hypothetical protein